MKNNEKNIEKFKAQKEHEFFLKREIRRLKEEDFLKMKERQKRLEFIRKMDILNKEKMHDNYIKRNKTQIERFKKSRMRRTVKEMFDKQKLFQTMVNMNASRMSPKKFLKSQNIELNVQFRDPPKLKEEDQD